MRAGRASRACVGAGSGGNHREMPSLKDILQDEAVREQAIDACVDLVDDEVKAKRGLSGAAIKTGYSVVQKIKPGMVRTAVKILLPEFAEALEPWHEKSQAGEGPHGPRLESALQAERGPVAEALLGVTDRRISEARPSIRRTYERLRGSAKGHVETAVPGLARALARFV